MVFLPLMRYIMNDFLENHNPKFVIRITLIIQFVSCIISSFSLYYVCDNPINVISDIFNLLYQICLILTFLCFIFNFIFYLASLKRKRITFSDSKIYLFLIISLDIFSLVMFCLTFRYFLLLYTMSD